MKRVTWAIQNIWVQLFDLTFNSSPNRSQNTIESYYGYDCSRLKWSNIKWKWKLSNIFLKYLSSEIMELKKMRGEVQICYIVLLTLCNGDRRIVHWIETLCLQEMRILMQAGSWIEESHEKAHIRGTNTSQLFSFSNIDLVLL